MSIESLFLSPVYLPMLGAALILVTKHFFSDRRRRAVEYLSAFIAFILPLVAFIFFLIKPVLAHHQVHMILGTWKTALGIHYHFDGLSFLLITLNLLISIPVWLYSRKTGPHQETFTIIFLIQSASIAATSLTADLFNLFVCLEVMGGVTSYVLVASSEKDEAILSSFTYLLFSATAMVFFLIGTFGLYRISGSLAYDTIAQAKKTHLLEQTCLLPVSRLS